MSDDDFRKLALHEFKGSISRAVVHDMDFFFRIPLITAALQSLGELCKTIVHDAIM